MTATAEKQEIWSEVEREAWSLPADLSVSEWADTYRMLDPKTSAEPGHWRTARTPYLREPMDQFKNDEVEHIILKFCTQVGKTESMLNMLGYAIVEDPGTVLFVKPTEDDAKELSDDRVKPMIEATPQLYNQIQDWGTAKQRSKYQIKRYTFRRMYTYFGWSGSPSSLAARAVRYLFRDEIDKFPRWSGDEGSPMELSSERTKTFWNSKTIDSSTPTTNEGNIWRLWEVALQKYYYVPCPHCGEYQDLKFPQLKWPEAERDHRTILEDRLAWYECEKCKGRIEDIHKPELLARGAWLAPAYQTITRDGQIIGECPTSRMVGYHLNAFYAPWSKITFSAIAAKFLASRGDPEKLMNFVNSWLAEPWLEKVEATNEEKLQPHILAYSRGTVPDRAKVLTAGIDMQKNEWYVVVRAWGSRWTSWLVDEFIVPHYPELPGDDDWDTLYAQVFGRQYGYVTHSLGFLQTAVAGVDSGYLTSNVYAACMRRPMLRPTKGESTTAGGVYPSTLDKMPDGKALVGGLKLWNINPDYFKEKIHMHLKVQPEQPGYFAFHRDVTEDYLRQLSAEHQIKVRPKRTSKIAAGYKLVWVVKEGYRANHYLDCEVIAMAMAQTILAGYIVDDTPGRPRSRVPSSPPPTDRTDHGGFINRGRKGKWW